MKTITVFLLFVLVSSSSFATTPDELQWVAQRQGDLLFLHWKDKELHTNSCGITVEKFEYLPKLRSLLLETRREFCAFDVLDRSQGIHIWKMPYYLLGGGELHLFLNGKSAGSVLLDSEGVSLKPSQGGEK